ncbi:MAG: tRNA (cytidine(34)-2'-O)-methyltransferase [Sphingomonas sp.]|nr:tRNA (cytidine(34)-2'-O)-methyltransferase [Sphingomonas sp.]
MSRLPASPSSAPSSDRHALRIALYEPEIAGNVGAILRTAACFDIPVDLIEPLGFAFSDRSLARAGMDYAATAVIKRHVDWTAFTAAVTGRIVLFTTKGAARLPATRFMPGDILLFGAESAGVPDFVHDRADVRVRIPLRPGLRSLNIGASAAIGMAEALRQLDAWPSSEGE